MKRIWFKRKGMDRMESALLDWKRGIIRTVQGPIPIQSVSFDVPITGTVYNILFNYKGVYESFEPSMYKPPYIHPPKSPVLYMKPGNTLIAHKSSIPVPRHYSSVMVGPSLGFVIGKRAKRVKKEEARSYIQGLIIANDVQIPHKNFYRPAIKEIARDGFCPIGPWIVDIGAFDRLDRLQIRVLINGDLKLENHTGNMVQTFDVLLERITDFMTLEEGDVLLTGIPENAPLAKRKDVVTVEIEGIGRLENELMDESLWKGEKG
ncbi:fumarylacetoacetate hydrolase family protein [Fervidibacillus halotolerans]|uniref:Fumarylacetoacetate hydrolase family protein n=1 Tax=Fervidibacillus halotolerans TaxID=2980027 RepID=A0A9E8RZR6_9BACI|nr:fumarylacetoacetate hydrolase family protein [Fervidibacillus halotolerans]WAA13424.1 fumarylacetoacetate hydrolase family protein [Fervidibacillus halotolerans]